MDLETALQAAAVIAMAAALSRIISSRLPIPSPVILLLTGVALGHDGLNIIKVSDLGELAPLAISLSVALIVFEGGTLVRAGSLRQMAPTVQRLVIGGLVFTTVLGMIAAVVFMGWPWRAAALFGALVCVTGPSVIGPLLQSVPVNDRIGTILMAEGVIIDPFGALLTLFLLQVAVASSFDATGPTTWVLTRIATGIIAGLLGTALLQAVPRIVKRLGSREVSLLVVATAVLVFTAAESVARESGITAMVVMGIVSGNLPLPHRDAAQEFQESIVSFLVATVYILLAASVSLRAVGDLWPDGFLTVAILVIVGRPLLVLISSLGSGLNWRERVFLCAVAPRGVVAASLASVVAIGVSANFGVERQQFVALVFVVILLTIGIQSGYALPLSRILRVYPVKTVIAGYGRVGSRVAARLRDSGEDVLVVELEGDLAVQGREDGFEVLLGDIAKREVLQKAGVGEARALILATGNDERALLAAGLARSQFGQPTIFARVEDSENMSAFEAAGITVVNPQVAVADELAQLAGASPLNSVLAGADSEVMAARIAVTNPIAQGTLQSQSILRGAVVVTVKPDSRNVVRRSHRRHPHPRRPPGGDRTRTRLLRRHAPRRGLTVSRRPPNRTWIATLPPPAQLTSVTRVRTRVYLATIPPGGAT
ncbi:cation:proton antiporter [bacterium]|nr:cation:proton antiporter [bacterium]